MEAVHMAIMTLYHASNQRKTAFATLYAQCEEQSEGMSRKLKPRKYVHCRVKDDKPRATYATNNESLQVGMRRVHTRGCTGRGRTQTRRSLKASKQLKGGVGIDLSYMLGVQQPPPIRSAAEVEFQQKLEYIKDHESMAQLLDLMDTDSVSPYSPGMSRAKSLLAKLVKDATIDDLLQVKSKAFIQLLGY